MNDPGPTLIDQLLTPEVMADVDPALAGLGIDGPDRVRESFTGCHTWTEMFGSTAGPFMGIGGAAITSFRFTLIHSTAAMVLFATNERFDRPQLFGVARYEESALESPDWSAFTRVVLR